VSKVPCSATKIPKSVLCESCADLRNTAISKAFKAEVPFFILEHINLADRIPTGITP
jgi:hypothetical protein